MSKALVPLDKDWLSKSSLKEVKESYGVAIRNAKLNTSFSSNTFYTLQEVAAKLKVSKKYLYEQIYKGDLKGTKIGRLYRIEEREIETWLTSQQRR